MLRAVLFRMLPLLILSLLLSLGVFAHSGLQARLSAPHASEGRLSAYAASRKLHHSGARAPLHGTSFGVAELSVSKYNNVQPDSRLTTQNDGQFFPDSLSNLASSQSDSGKECAVSFKGTDLTFAGCSGKLNEDIEIYYNISDTSIETLIRVPRADRSYIGFGWGCEKMVPCHAVVASVAGSSRTVDNYHLTSYALPSSPADNVISDEDIDFQGGFIIARFTRPLKSDVADVAELSGDTYKFIWSLGELNADNVEQQHSTEGQKQQLDVVTGTFSGNTADALRRAHAILMGLAWLIFAPMAVLAMRFFKRYNPVTFRIHMALAITVLSCTVIAVLLVIFKTNHTGKNHMGVGYTVLILVSLQVLAGILRPNKAASIRTIWHLGHMTSGLIAIILAFINIIIGIGVIGGGKVWYVIVSLVFLAEIALFLIFSILKRNFPTVQTEGKPSRSYTPSDPADDSLII